MPTKKTTARSRRPAATHAKAAVRAKMNTGRAPRARVARKKVPSRRKTKAERDREWFWNRFYAFSINRMGYSPEEAAEVTELAVQAFCGELDDDET